MSNKEQESTSKPIYKILHDHPNLPVIGEDNPYCMFDAAVLSSFIYFPILNVPIYKPSKSDENTTSNTSSSEGPAMSNISVTVGDICNCIINECLFGDKKANPCEEEEHVYRRYCDLFKNSSEGSECMKLLLSLKDCNRYKNIEVSDFWSVYEKDPEPAQFAVMTFFVKSQNLRIVVFRGTDGTKAGWKEDLMLGGKTVKSCEKASEYMKDITEKYKGDKFVVAGHSKGGILALYGALKEKDVREHILTDVKDDKGVGVINLDGPGLKTGEIKVLDDNLNKAVMTYIPQTSIIGVTIKGQVNAGSYQCIKSNETFVMQHSLSSWLFNDNGDKSPTPVVSDQDDVSRYFEDAFKTLLKKFGDGVIDLNSFIETIFSLIPTDEKGDLICVNLKFESLWDYLEKFLSYNGKAFDNVVQIFATLMECLEDHLKSEVKGDIYDIIIIAHVLVTSVKELLTYEKKEIIKKVFISIIESIRTRKLSFSLGEALDQFLKEGFSVICEKVHEICIKAMGTLREKESCFSCTSKDSLYEHTMYRLYYVGAIAGKLKERPSKSFFANVTGSRALLYARLLIYFKNLLSNGIGSLPPTFVMPQKDELFSVVSKNAEEFSKLRGEEKEVALSEKDGIRLEYNREVNFKPKVSFKVSFRKPIEKSYNLIVMKLGIEPIKVDKKVEESVGNKEDIENGKMIFREIKSESFKPSKAGMYTTDIEMDTFGIYYARVSPEGSDEAICQVYMPYLPVVQLIPLIKGNVIEVNYSIWDEYTNAILDLNKWKEEKWWVGVFKKDENGCISIISCMPCLTSNVSRKALLSIPDSEGEYFVRFYTSFTAGYYNEVPLIVEHPKLLEAHRVILPEKRSSLADESGGEMVEMVEICVDWTLVSGISRVCAWVGLFGSDISKPIKTADLLKSENYRVFNGRIRFSLTQEEADKLESIRLYSNWGGCADEKYLVAKLDKGEIRWEEEVLLSRHNKSLKWKETGEMKRMEWLNTNPNSSIVFVISPISSGSNNINIKVKNGKYICVTDKGSRKVELCDDNTEPGVFKPIRNKDGTLSFQINGDSSDGKKEYLAADKTGNMYVMNNFDDLDNFLYGYAKFSCPRLQKEGRYTLCKGDLCLTSKSITPSFGIPDGVHEFLDIIFLSRANDENKGTMVLIKFVNGQYLSRLDGNKLCYSSVVTQNEIFVMKSVSKGVVYLDLGSGKEKFSLKSGMLID